MGYFGERLVGWDAPTIEQGEACIELMQAAVRSVPPGEAKVTRRFPGKAFLLPGAVTEWSVPDRKFRRHIEHDRHYSALVRYGDVARKLVVLETESWFQPEGDQYYTERNMYRLEWDGAAMRDAQVLRTEILSPATTYAVALPRGYRDDLLLEVTEELEFDEETNMYKDPKSYRMLTHELLRETDVDNLLDRMAQFQQGMVSARGIDYSHRA